MTEARQIGIGPQCARDETRWLQCERGLAARSHSAGCRFSVVRSWSKITLWLFNIAMENGPFIDDFPIETSIYKGFSIVMLVYQRVCTAQTFLRRRNSLLLWDKLSLWH